ncbi:MAG: aspartate aminotransferase family protein [Rickettsiales bacterium]|nr:aspartate aminotransferase family protein [Rickettsiales bacterium]
MLLETSVTSYMPVYRRADITMVRGEGVYLYDDTGKAYLDCASGIAVNALGHCHPKVVAALKDQADLLWHCSNNYKNDQLLDFSERLVAQCNLDSVFFSCSGAEAVESGIKFMRRYHYANGEPKRNRIITFENGFHGRSITCISAGGNEIAREGFEPLLDGFDHVPFNDIEAVKAAITDQTAGILIEPIQGEGGVHVADKEFLQALRKLCDDQGLLLFFDEVQCGYGRSGALFIHQLFDVTPDIVACAKGIGNGFPLGATIVNTKVANAMTPGCHGSTYGSNPLAMAVGNAVLDVMLEDSFFDQVNLSGSILVQRLEALRQEFPTLIDEVRGIGLMIGIKMKADARAFAESLRLNGLLLAPAYGNVLRMIPPLIITEEEVIKACDLFKETLIQQMQTEREAS